MPSSRPPRRAPLARALPFALAALAAAPAALAAAPAPAGRDDASTTAPPAALARRDAARDDDARTLEPVLVRAPWPAVYQGEARFDAALIEALPRGNGDLAGLLRLNPNVQLDDAARSQRTPGEIRPADVSINGAPWYQNRFQLDGTGITNDLDPASVNPNHYADPPSTTQGVAVDTSLLERLGVFDANVPARFGGFNGGVVDAVTRRARDGGEGRVVIRHTRDAWTDRLVDPSEDAAYELSTSAARQAYFDKTELRASWEDRTDGGLGWLVSLREQRSTIPLRGAANGFESPSDQAVKEQTRANRGVFLRLDQGGDGWHTDLSLNYAPTDERYFIQNARDSWFDLEQGGPVLSLRDSRELGAWTLATRLGFSDLDSSRRSDVGYWKSWRWSTAQDWGAPTSRTALSTEGSWGDVDQAQRSSDVDVSLARAPVEAFGFEHRLAGGLQLEDREAWYARINDHFVYLRPTPTSTCTDANGVLDVDGCSLAPTLFDGRGQYFAQRDTYRAGRVDVAVRSLGAWIEDELRRGDLSLRLGLRYDRDDQMARDSLGPRASLRWDVAGSDHALLAGASRYYGRNFFANALRDGRESLKITQTRTGSLVYGAPTTSTSLNRYQDLRIPYADETMLGWQWSAARLRADLKWVHRDGRDEILRRRVRETDPAYAANVYTYVNDGRSRNDTVTLTLAPNAPLALLGSTSTWQLAFDHTDTRRSYSDYESSLDPVDAARPVIYGGTKMRYDELPQSNYNRPWSVRAATTTTFGDTGLSLANTLVARGGFPALVNGADVIEDGVLYETYEDGDIPAAITLDTQLTWRFSAGGFAPWVRLEVSNVTNRRNVVAIASGREVYELGRQVWLELGTTF